MFLINELIALLAANMILVQALGTSTLFIAAESRKNLIATASVITVFTTLSSMATYLINRVTGDRLEDFTLLFYVLAVGILYVLLLAVFFLIAPKTFEKYKKYIHISAYNCAVMGTVFTINEKEALSAADFSLTDYLSCGFEAGVGFILAALILTVAYGKLNSAKVPTSFRGFPAMLVYLGIISMAVYSLK